MDYSQHLKGQRISLDDRFERLAGLVGIVIIGQVHRWPTSERPTDGDSSRQKTGSRINSRRGDGQLAAILEWRESGRFLGEEGWQNRSEILVRGSPAPMNQRADMLD